MTSQWKVTETEGSRCPWVSQWQGICLPVHETQGTWVWSLDHEDPLQKGMVTHSSILAWRIPWTEEPDRLQFMWSWRVGHDEWLMLLLSLSLSLGPVPSSSAICSPRLCVRAWGGDSDRVSGRAAGPGQACYSHCECACRSILWSGTNKWYL